MGNQTIDLATTIKNHCDVELPHELGFFILGIAEDSKGRFCVEWFLFDPDYESIEQGQVNGYYFPDIDHAMRCLLLQVRQYLHGQSTLV